MGNVMQLKIDPDIKLGPECDDMPDSIRGNLLATLTMKANKCECHWTELEWKVKMTDGQPIIYVKRKQ